MKTYEARNAKGKLLTSFAAHGKEHAKRIATEWNERHTAGVMRITELIDVSPVTVGQAAQRRAEEFREEVRHWPDEKLLELFEAGYLGNIAQTLGRSGRGTYEELRRAIREVAPRVETKMQKLSRKLEHEVNGKRLR